MTLEQLPNGIKQLAEQRISEQKDTWTISVTEKSSVAYFFDWNKTVEGSNFWVKISAGVFAPYFEKYPKHEWVYSSGNQFSLYYYNDKLCVTDADGKITLGIEDLEIKPTTTTAYKESSGKLFYEIDWPFITQMAERMAANKKDGKYDLYNWKKPMDEKGLEDLKQAMLRHLIEILNGVYEDDGREFGHLESLSCNAMMLNYQLKNIKK